jgi:DNA recombination protein RmuC
MPFGVAVVPDAVYEVCSEVQAQAFQMRVVLVSYSMFVPYLLLVIETVFKSAGTIDVEKVRAYLERAADMLDRLQDEVEGRLSRGITMLQNSRDAMSGQVALLRSGLQAIEERTAPGGGQQALVERAVVDSPLPVMPR